MNTGGVEVSESVCSFCGSTFEEVNHLIKGTNAFICDDCVIQCQGVLENHKKKKKKEDPDKAEKTPAEIVAHLNEYVIGQFEAKKALALALYHHYKRINHDKKDIEIQKSNVMLIGPSGVGKTMLVSTLAKLFDVPVSINDATSFTEAGYVGDDVDQMVSKLVVAANGDVKKAERGIILVDEVDKLAKVDSFSGKDIRGEGVQQAILKMIEGTVVQVNPQGGKKNPNGSLVDVDTSNILFIFSGAFVGLTNKQNLKKNPLGFAAPTQQETNKKITHKDLIKFGMIPEVMGRIPVVIELQPLEKPDLIRILKEPKNSILAQYEALFKMDGVTVEFSDCFLEKIVERAVQETTGARGLRALIENSLRDVLFDAPTLKPKKLFIDSTYVK